MDSYRLTFKDDELKDMLTHMKKNRRTYPYNHTEAKEYGLWLVKDDGIYIMSPTDIRYKKVIYATGFNPEIDNEDDGLWNRTYEVSPDDFAEYVPLSEGMIDRISDKKKFTIDLTETEIHISVE